MAVGAGTARLLVLGILLSSSALDAQEPRSAAPGLDPDLALTQYVLESWTEDDGLPHNAVMAVVQTRDGYIWLGTLGGLVRFDGVRFTVFDRSNTPDMASEFVRALAESSDGALWAGLDRGGLLRIMDGRIEAIPGDDRLASGPVDILHDDGRDGVFAGTGSGLRHVTPAGVDPLPPDWAQVPIVGVDVDSDGVVWMTSIPAGLLTFRDGTFARFPEAAGLPQALHSVLIDRAGTIWIGGQHGELIRIDGADVSWHRDGRDDRRAIMSLLEDRSGTLWVATNGDGLLRFAEGEFSALTPADGLGDERTRQLLQDAEGSLWFGSYGGGLQRLREAPITTFPMESESQETWSLTQDTSGRIWAATETLHYRSGPSFSLADTGRPLPLLRSILARGDGSLWALPLKGGLIRLEDGRAEDVPVPEEHAWSDGHGLLEDSRGALWIGTGSGVRILEDGEWNALTVDHGLPHPHWVDYLFEDDLGRVWVATTGGLARVVNGAVEKVWDGFWARTVFQSEDGVIWAGTAGEGLIRLSRQDEMTVVAKTNGLFDNYVWAIVGGSDGRLWMCSDRGIFAAPLDQLNAFANGESALITSQSFGIRDGLKDLECNGGQVPSAVRTRNGSIWFPTHAGVARVRPSHVRPNPLPPPVYVEEVRGGERRIGRPTHVVVEPDERDLEFHFTGLSFLDPTEVKFRYRLLGHDPDWQELEGRRWVRYNRVEPGDYEFQVFAANSDGLWNEQPARVTVSVLPMFYETWWFAAVLVLLGLTLVAGLHLLRTAGLRAKGQQLEAMVSSRTRALEYAKDQALTANRAKDRFLARMSHELRTPLNAIIGFAEVLEDQTFGKMNEIQARYVSNVLTGGHHLLNLINDLLDLSKIDEGMLRLSVSTFDPREVVTGLEPSIRELAKGRGVRVVIEHPERGFQLTADRLRLTQILLNLISNGVKFAQEGGRVTLRYGLRPSERDHGVGDRVWFSVQDDGMGVTAEDRERIFRPFEQADSPAGAPQGTGLGLPLSRSLAEQHGGRVWVESDGPGRGSTFWVELDRVTDPEAQWPVGRPKGNGIGPFRSSVTREAETSEPGVG